MAAESVLINQFVPPTFFCLYFAFTGINFSGMLHHVCDVAYGENMSGPVRTRKFWSANWLINSVWFWYKLYRWSHPIPTYRNPSTAIIIVVAFFLRWCPMKTRRPKNSKYVIFVFLKVSNRNYHRSKPLAVLSDAVRSIYIYHLLFFPFASNTLDDTAMIFNESARMVLKSKI